MSVIGPYSWTCHAPVHMPCTAAPLGSQVPRGPRHGPPAPCVIMAQPSHRGNKQGRAQRDESLESLESRGASQGLAAPQGLAALPPGFPARPPGCPATMPGMPPEPWQAHQDLEHRGQHHPDARGSAGPAPRPSWPPPNPAGPPEPAHQALVTLEQGPAQRSFNWYRRQQDLTRRGGGGPPTPQVEFGGPHRDQPRRLLGSSSILENLTSGSPSSSS